MKHIVSFSGGKDSTAMLLMMEERGMQIDDIVFADTGMEFPEVYEVIKQVESIIGKKITRLKGDKTFEWMFTSAPKKSGKQAGMIGKGWPSMFCRWCTGALKRDPLKEYYKQIGDEFTLYIGIAADETPRTKHAMTHKNTRFPLVEWGVKEEDAFQYCFDRNITWRGAYKNRKRLSCFLCPMQRISDWRDLRENYPDLWKRALELDASPAGQRNKLRQNMTLADLEKRFCEEDKQGLLF